MLRSGAPEQMQIELSVDDPTFLIDPERFLVRFVHHLTYAADSPRGEDGENTQVAKLEVAHIAELILRGDPPQSDVVSAFIHSTVVFVVHPYVRASLQRLATDLDLPPVTLPFLRRSLDGPPAGDEPD